MLLRATSLTYAFQDLFSYADDRMKRLLREGERKSRHPSMPQEATGLYGRA